MDYMLRADTPQDGNGTKTVLLPSPANIKDILLQVSSGTVTAAQLGTIRVLANGKPTIDIDGTSLDEINKYDKLAAFGGTVMRVPLGLIGAADPALKDITGLNVGVTNPESGSRINSLQFYMACSGATNPVWALGCNASDPDPMGPGICRKLNSYTLATAAGSESILTLPTIYGGAEYAYIRRVFIKAPTGTVSQARIMIGQDTKWDSNTAMVQRLQADSQQRTVGSYWNLVAEFPPDILSGKMGAGKAIEDMPWLNVVGAAQNSQSLRIGVTNSAAENCTIIVEALGAAPGL